LVLKKNLEREQVSVDKHPSPCVWQAYLRQSPPPMLVVQHDNLCQQLFSSCKCMPQTQTSCGKDNKPACARPNEMTGMQIIGALIVAAGVCLAAAPSDAGANIFQQVCKQAFVSSTHEGCRVLSHALSSKAPGIVTPYYIRPHCPCSVWFFWFINQIIYILWGNFCKKNCFVLSN